MTRTNEQFRQEQQSRSLTGGIGLRFMLFCACSSIAASSNAETRAGDNIVNTASIRYGVDDVEQIATSNTDVIVVAERLDVALTRTTDGALASSVPAVPLLLVNRGNGMEAFRLSATVDRGTPPTRFAVDTDGNGRYEADRDTLLSNATTPMLEPGASLPLLLLGAFEGTSITVAAAAVTGSGTPGTTFAAGGDGGGDAIVGPTGARAEVTVPLIAQGNPPTLTKTQSVLAPDGSARGVRGAIVTYTLAARFADASASARIDDPVPAGTDYVPGSLLLDGTPLTDATDGDAGQANTTMVGAVLGTVPAAATRTLQFKVRVQ